MESDRSRQSLAPLVDAVFDELPDDNSRRRWGRGLQYFRGRLDEVSGPRSAVVVRDIADFLGEQHGLRRSADKLPVALNKAVARLDEECRRYLDEEPRPSFTFGIISGAQAPQAPQVSQFVNDVEGVDDPGGDLTINLVVLLAGQIASPDWSGVQVGRLHALRRAAVVNVAPPAGITGDELDAFLMDALAQAVERTEKALRRRHLPWSTAPHRRIVQRMVTARSAPTA